MTFSELLKKAKTELNAGVEDIGDKGVLGNIRNHVYFYLPNGCRVSILHEFAPRYVPGVPIDWGWELMVFKPNGEDELLLDGVELDAIWKSLKEVSEMKWKNYINK